MGTLANRIIFLTGGASGIGEACATAYASAGASVFILDNQPDRLTETLARLGSPHAGFAGDVSYEADVKAAVEQALQTFGRIDAIHNNAGSASPSKSLDQTTEDEWDQLMAINLKSVYWTTRYGLEALKQTRGCVLNTSSMVGELGQPIHAAYVASKGAMNALTKAMALDYAPFGIRVNAVCPAGVWTPMLRDWAKTQPNPAAIETYLNEIHTLGYCPEAHVVADVCVFLLSDAARFVTGCLMPVGGGAELGYRR
ncbi:SDR family NAD(P)-dependent oxidoreductase [Spirosoma montaniterrae]|uniref:Short-chain dehydrogenase n=1 Tax=Spirosoma montaniterrae TaxID=1178516 RepID=A0A1P9X2Z9_9BACT|nr:SDR family oxidoreductase [Spirosoma montaniterrae]AQG81975.1 short-chain dehydrogenase [Spirosoma montaniterrae]